MVIFHSYVNVYQRVVGNYELTRHTWKLFFFKTTFRRSSQHRVSNCTPCWDFRRVVMQRVLIVFVLHFMKQVDVCGFWRSRVTAFCGPIPHRKKNESAVQIRWSCHEKLNFSDLAMVNPCKPINKRSPNSHQWVGFQPSPGRFFGWPQLTPQPHWEWELDTLDLSTQDARVMTWTMGMASSFFFEAWRIRWSATGWGPPFISGFINHNKPYEL